MTIFDNSYCVLCTVEWSMRTAPPYGWMQAVSGARGLPVHVVVKGVVATQGNERTKTKSIREEDLGGCIQPNLTTHTQAHTHA